MHASQRPQSNEFDPYYQGYINQVERDHFIHALQNQKASSEAFWLSIPEDRWEYAYAPDKWTIKEILLHIIDTERVFAYRALRISRNDLTPLPGFDQNDYALYSEANSRSVASLIDEYLAVRESSILLFSSMSEGALLRLGTANNAPCSPRALGFIIAGHENHHLRILRERYL
ncbi:MAG: DinB family protein [Bacteroidota bacterium]